jgi:hypothetical protein
VTGNGTNAVSLQGSVAAINAALGTGVNYRVGSSGTQTLTAEVNDLGNNGGVAGDPDAENPLTASATVSIEVLDFVPSNLGGYVWADANQNGAHGSNEKGLEGVEIRLSGTDGISGAAIDTMSVFTDREGKYSFPNMRPGTYIIEKIHPVHFIDGPDHFESPAVALGADRGMIEIDIRGGVNSMANNFAIIGLNGVFFDGIELETPHQPGGELYNNILFAIDSSDPTSPPKTAVVYTGDVWGGYSNARVALSSDGKSATVTLFETATDTWKSATFSFDSARFRVRSMGTLSTIRVFFTPEMLNVTNVNAAQYAQAVDQVMAGVA